MGVHNPMCTNMERAISPRTWATQNHAPSSQTRKGRLNTARPELMRGVVLHVCRGTCGLAHRSGSRDLMRAQHREFPTKSNESTSQAPGPMACKASCASLCIGASTFQHGRGNRSRGLIVCRDRERIATRKWKRTTTKKTKKQKKQTKTDRRNGRCRPCRAPRGKPSRWGF